MRVSDIVAELDKRMGTLRRQAQKAERYRKYKAELKDIELWKASHRWLELTGEGQLVARPARRGARRARGGARDVDRRKDAHVVAERAELAVEERRLVGVQEQRLRAREPAPARREQDRVRAARGRGARRRGSPARATEIEQITAQRERGAAELAARQAELAALEAEVERESAEVAAREAAAGEGRQMLTNVQGRLDEARARARLAPHRDRDGRAPSSKR